MLTKDQVSGIADRVLLVLCSWLVAKGYITTDQVGNIVSIGLGVVALVWGWYVNRQQAIVKAAANIPNTTVVTTPDLATSTPQTNVVSNESNKVVSK